MEGVAVAFVVERESTTVVPMLFELDGVETVPDPGTLEVIITAPSGERPTWPGAGWAVPTTRDDGRLGPSIGPGTSWDFSGLPASKYPYDRRVWSRLIEDPDREFTDHGLFRVR